MAKLKLTYFDFPISRGEECRLALHVSGVDFEDHRIPSASWPELKAGTPFGALPTLEAEGKPTLAQSSAILAYVGRTYGLHPDDPWEAARHEALFAAVEEYRHAAGLTGSKDEDEKKQKREAFAAGFLQTWAGQVERQIEGPFVAGEKLNVVDLKIFTIVDAIAGGAYDYIGASDLAAFPKLLGLREAVSKNPKVAEWKARSA